MKNPEPPSRFKLKAFRLQEVPSAIQDPSRAFYPLPHDKFFGCDQMKAFAVDILNIAKMMIFLLDKEENTLWEKEKMLLTSIFSFSHSVFQSYLLKESKNSGLCGKELSSKTYFQVLHVTYCIW